MNVVQEWVSNIPMMQQTVLLTAIRGPDGTPKYSAAKYLLRWYRRCVLLSAMDGRILNNPVNLNGGSFTGPSCNGDLEKGWKPEMDKIVGDYLKELDAIPHHFHMHLMHAAEILGRKHPDEGIRDWWLLNVYCRFVKDMHLEPENEATLDHRLGDVRDQWLQHADEATQN